MASSGSGNNDGQQGALLLPQQSAIEGQQRRTGFSRGLRQTVRVSGVSLGTAGVMVAGANLATTAGSAAVDERAIAGYSG